MTEANVALEDLLNFKCEKTISAFHYSYGVSIEESNIIFEDLIRFIWMNKNISNLSLDESVCNIDPAIVVIDEMWHTFILHTKDYIDFCMKNFGSYIHHQPHPKDNTQRSLYELDETKITEAEKLKRRKYSCIFDLFGEHVFKRWYLHYPSVYSSKQLLDRLKK